MMISEGKPTGIVTMEELLEAYETHRKEEEGDTIGTEALEIAASLRPRIAAEVVQVLDDKAKPGSGW
jgi:hypothetical protein